MDKHKLEDEAADALREAVNAAYEAGNSPEAIHAIVNDQLFGIKHLGGGNVQALKKRVEELDKLARKQWDNE